MDSGNTGREKRLHTRFHGEMAEVKFRRLGHNVAGEPDSFHDGRLIDVSKGGMCFACEFALSRGGKIEYEISAMKGIAAREGVGRIVRVSRDADRFYVAVVFMD